MKQALNCVLMRGGTSRGPVFRSDWLPADAAERDRALLSAMGSPHALQIDGLGGGSSLTSKVAIVSASTHPGCDIDYLFAQVSTTENRVDTRPNCGNMLSAAAPFAIEQGMIKVQGDTTCVRIFNVNTGATIEAQVQTPDGQVSYDGNTAIDGVPGTAAPVHLGFMNAWGAKTGQLFPSGQRVDLIDGVPVTCIDAVMPLIVIEASSLGVTGKESAAALDAHPGLLTRLERIRRQAGFLMGLGDVSQSVLPKPILISPGTRPRSIASRYFTPHRCHTAHAVTGAIGLASTCMLEGTTAFQPEFVKQSQVTPIDIEHPSGAIQISLSHEGQGTDLRITRASVIRTARKIMEGKLYLPDYAH